MRPEAPGVRAKDFLPLLGLRTRESAYASCLKAPSGGVKYQGPVVPTTAVFDFGTPQTQGQVFLNYM